MIHLGKDTKSKIISKGISAKSSQNTYRGQVTMAKGAKNSRNFTQCDSLLIGSDAGAHTFPSIDVMNSSSILEHEATTSKIADEQLFYCMQRGISEEDAIGLIVSGFCKEVLNELPMEFAVEARALLQVNLEGAIG
jgi:Fe-S cluster assembly protein SufB